MGNENGTWIMYGVEENDPECIHTAEELIEYIKEIGFLPLFRNEIPGFSVEERTVPAYWWSDDPVKDPWLWREKLAAGKEIAYGKFFGNKAGFISKEWFPYFANYRRDGYDFDSLWDDEKASLRQKKIMDLFDTDAEYFSFEAKGKAGFEKGGEKGFEGVITQLQMQTYLLVNDFRHKKNKAGNEYGMAVAVYAMPEHKWGYDYVTSAYSEDPLDSGMRIVKHMLEEYGIAAPEQIKKLLGLRPGETAVRSKKEKEVSYPQNLFAALKMPVNKPTKEQLIELEYALSNLEDQYAEIIRLRFEKGYTINTISEYTGASSGQISYRCRKALETLKSLFPDCTFKVQ